MTLNITHRTMFDCFHAVGSVSSVEVGGSISVVLFVFFSALPRGGFTPAHLELETR